MVIGRQQTVIQDHHCCLPCGKAWQTGNQSYFYDYRRCHCLGAGLVQEVVWFFNLRDVIFASQDMINLNGAQIISKSEFLNYFVTIGASGAVFGILLAFAMIFPNVPLYLMFIPIPIKAKYFVIFYGLAELFMGVASFGGDTVAHFAHLGGMLFGYFLIRYWKKKDADNGRYFY